MVRESEFMNKYLSSILCYGCCLAWLMVQSRHSPSSQYPTYEGRVLCDYEGMPSDHYLWLAGMAGKTLRGEIPLSNKLPVRAEQTK